MTPLLSHVGWIVMLMILITEVNADEKLEEDFAVWRKKFGRDLAAEASRPSNASFVAAFQEAYVEDHKFGVPQGGRTAFPMVRDFRRWVHDFANTDFARFLDAVLEEFTPGQRHLIMRQCLTRQAPRLIIRHLRPLQGEAYWWKRELVLDPTIPGTCYETVRENMAHELIHYLIEAKHCYRCPVLAEGMTEYLTWQAGSHLGWHPVDASYPEHTKLVELIIGDRQEQLRDWFVGVITSDEQVFQSLYTYTAVRIDRKTQNDVWQTIGLLKTMPPYDFGSVKFVEQRLSSLMDNRQPHRQLVTKMATR